VRHPSAHIFDFTPETLRQWCNTRGLPPYRAAQILEWVYQKGIADPAKMSNLSKRDRDLLADPSDGLTFLSGDTVSQQVASDGTQKLLIQWPDGNQPVSDDTTTSLPILGTRNSGGAALGTSDPTRQTECVMIPTDDRKTACISSQVGCPVGCKFCASGIGGLDGNLSAGRIVEQVWRLRDVLNTSGSEGRGTQERISNVVFMGMGEPLSNFAAVTHAIRTLNAEWGMGISARRITISTVGLPKAIEKLADEFDLPVTLALSLHAPNDDIRRQLIPWAE
jgi:23S rRNA (adenine2503-C2)-methyltransferase